MLNGNISSVSGKVDTSGTNLAVDSDAIFAVGATNNIAIGNDAADGMGSLSNLDNIFIGNNAGGGGWTGTASSYNIGIGSNVMDAAMNAALRNTGMGYGTLGGITSGDDNTAIGANAGNAIGSGSDNVAIGSSAMGQHTTGGSNTVIGYGAMSQTDEGVSSLASESNVFIGKDSGGGIWTNAGCDFNVAIGASSMSGLMAGTDFNTAVGFQALQALTSGGSNTGIGRGAGKALTTGASHAFVGAECGDATVGSTGNTAMGYQALSAAADSYNVAMGYKAGNATTGGKNVMIGSAAGEDLIGGSSNVFIGKDAARNITVGIRGVAIGEAALDTATGSGIGYYNVAIGFNVFKTANFTAHNGSIGIGYKAGYYVNPDSGADSTAGNVLIGMYSGMDEGDSQGLTTGLYNTAIGHETLGTNCGSSGNLTGDGNTVMGYRAGYGLKLAAADNTFIGKSAGGAVTEGTQNVLIGSGTVTNAQGDDNSIVIGYGAAGLGSNYAVIGNASITRVYMAAGGDAVMYADGTINTSDMRFKENIKECDLGLDFINKINPVKYNFKEDSNTKYGIIAQEVLKALEDTGIKESSFIATDNPDKLGADYVQFIAPLIKAVQELSQQIEDLKKG